MKKQFLKSKISEDKSRRSDAECCHRLDEVEEENCRKKLDEGIENILREEYVVKQT